MYSLVIWVAEHSYGIKMLILRFVLMYIASLTHYWIVYYVLKGVLFLAALCYFRAHARAHVASQDIQHESKRYSLKLPSSCE